MSANDPGFIAALEEAKKGYEEGGIPSTHLPSARESRQPLQISMADEVVIRTYLLPVSPNTRGQTNAASPSIWRQSAVLLQWLRNRRCNCVIFC